jgi:hypothetical protein
MGFSIPDFSEVQSIPALIGTLFDLALWGLGLAIFIQILRAGYKRFFAFGNPGKASESNTLITGAVIGAVLLLSSVMILNTINPDLTKSTLDLSVFRDAAFNLQGLPVWNKALKQELTDLQKDCKCRISIIDQYTQGEGNNAVDVVRIQIHDTKGLVGYIVGNKSIFDYIRYFDHGDELGAREFRHSTPNGTFTYILFSRVYRYTKGFFDCAGSVLWRADTCDEAVEKDTQAYLEVRVGVGSGLGTGEDLVIRDEEGTKAQLELKEKGYIIADGVNVNLLRTEDTRELTQFRGSCVGCAPITIKEIVADVSVPYPGISGRFDRILFGRNEKLTEYIRTSIKCSEKDELFREICGGGKNHIYIPSGDGGWYMYIPRPV